jgi:branched-chain amino acid aminotransferase
VNPHAPLIWWRGGVVPAEEVSIPFLSAGLHYGLGVFEGIRAYSTDRGPAVFRLDEHVDRLLASARILGFRDLAWSGDDIGRAIVATVVANGFADCYIRPLIFLSSGGWGLDLDTGEPELGVAVWEWARYLSEEARQRGARAHVSSFTRHHPNVTMTKAKITGNYVNSVLAKTEAVRLGFDEAIQLDPQGFVAECTGENLFLVRRGRILTPPAATVLEGITRDTLITVARDLGYTVEEGPLSRDQLYLAEEAFVCGTAAEVVAVREIDFRPVGSGAMGPVTSRLQEAYHATVHGRIGRYQGWLTHVDRNHGDRELREHAAGATQQGAPGAAVRAFSDLLRGVRVEA